MTRVIEAEFETRAVKFETVMNRFFTKNPELKYWRETFEWMNENNKNTENDVNMADGTKNHEWTWALHLDHNDDDWYVCVIERA